MHPRTTQYPRKRTPKNVRTGARQGWAWCLAPEMRQGNPQLLEAKGGGGEEEHPFLCASAYPARLQKRASPDKKTGLGGGKGSLGSEESRRVHTWQDGLLASGKWGH